MKANLQRYYEVLTKCGHVGKGKYIDVLLYVRAENGSEAAQIAKSLPRVKRDLTNAISSVRQITATEYAIGRETNRTSPYLNAKNIQQQRMNCKDLMINELGWYKSTEARKKPRSEKKMPLKLKDPLKYQRYYGCLEATTLYL